MDPWDDFAIEVDSDEESGEYLEFDLDDYSGDFEFDPEEDYSIDEEQNTSADEDEDKDKSHFRIQGIDYNENIESRSKAPRSKTQKVFDAFNRCITKLNMILDDNNWFALKNEFSNLEKEKKKAKWYIDKEGYPGIYLCGIVMIGDALLDKEDTRKDMSSDNARSFNSVYRKYFEILKKDPILENLTKDYRENPELFVDEAFEDNEDDFDFQRSDEASDEDYFNKPLQYWYEFSEEDVDTRRVRTIKDKKEYIAKEEVRKPWTVERINKKIKQLIGQRGQKQYKKKNTLLLFEFLFRNCTGLRKRLQVGFHLINSIFDSSASSVHLPFRHWTYVYRLTVRIINTLFQHPEIKLARTQEEVEKAKEGLEEGEEPKNIVFGSLISILQRLNEELWRALQVTDANTQKYEDRCNYEGSLVLLAIYIEKYLSSIKKDFNRSCFVQLKHLYYLKEVPTPPGELCEDCVLEVDPTRIEDDDTPENDILNGEFPSFKIVTPPVENWKSVEEAVHYLTARIYKSGEVQLRTTTVLYHVYHLAIFGNYFRGRDLLMMTHIPDKIHTVDIKMQVLYNRCMAQLGIAAFRLLRMSDVHACVSDLLIGGRSKELLAQGISYRSQDKTTEEVSHERGRQYPYHMHINIDILEAVILIASMVLNVPNLSESLNKKSLKYFKKASDGYRKNYYTGPPENTRERIIVASDSLFNGEWKKAQAILDELDIWSLLEDSEGLKVKLYELLRKESLKAFLLTNGKYYDSLSLDLLTERFEITRGDVHAIISKMIFTRKLLASLDQVNDCVRIQSSVVSETEQLARKYAEKISQLLESARRSEREKRISV